MKGRFSFLRFFWSSKKNNGITVTRGLTTLETAKMHA
jgi:hypothetical protein